MWVSGEARGSQEDLILHPGARKLLGLWLDLKDQRPAPVRTDLDLRQFRRQAAWLFIVEPVGKARGYTYRLAGTAVCAFLKQEMTGKDFLTGWEPFERSSIQRALGVVTTKLQPAHFRLRYRTDKGQKIGADMLALPVMARDGLNVHVLGGLFPHGNPDIWHYERLAPADLASLRMFDGRPENMGARPEPQAPRKFRLISGGLDLP